MWRLRVVNCQPTQGLAGEKGQQDLPDDQVKAPFNHLLGYPKDVSLATADLEIIKSSCYVRTILLLPYYSLTGPERDIATGGLGSVSWEKGEANHCSSKAGQTSGESDTECYVMI